MKTLKITFNKNGASAIGATEQKCTIQNSATTCSITSPSITASSNTPTVVGWDSTSSYTSNEWSVNTPKEFSSNATYYAVTKKDAVTHNITYTKSTVLCPAQSSSLDMGSAFVARCGIYFISISRSLYPF